MVVAAPYEDAFVGRDLLERRAQVACLLVFPPVGLFHAEMSQAGRLVVEAGFVRDKLPAEIERDGDQFGRLGFPRVPAGDGGNLSSLVCLSRESWNQRFHREPATPGPVTTRQQPRP